MELPEDDMDDVDFEVDWSELLEEQLAQEVPQPPPKEKPPRTRAQHKRHARELESTARIRDRCV